MDEKGEFTTGVSAVHIGMNTGIAIDSNGEPTPKKEKGNK